MESKTMKLGLSLSGGGSRAIAFHLGCLRALHNLNVLDKVEVLSGVSGGAVLAALYSYSENSFDEFEQRILDLLSKGLQSDILKELLKPTFLVPCLLNNMLALIVGVVNLVLKVILFILSKISKLDLRSQSKKYIIPFPRIWTRTKAFENYLNKKLFHNKEINTSTRNNIKLVINACELKTGTAFRFGNNESGCWRFGKVINNEVKIATAVAASAAYPVFLPAIDRKWNLEKRNGNKNYERLYLTDGGVYDNLGVSCMEPGKSSEYSYNAYPCDFIICCNAGHGQFSTSDKPSWRVPRMTKSFYSVFRKVQDSYADKLHNYKNQNQIKGFIYSYLGQQDKKLYEELKSFIPDGFVSREEVFEYPTDFSKMIKSDINKIYNRGLQLTEMLIRHYNPESIKN